MSKLERKFYEFSRNFLARPYFSIPAFFFFALFLWLDSLVLRLCVIIVSLIFNLKVRPAMLERIKVLEKEL